MKITLVFAPYHHLAFEENIKVVDNDFGCFPPISLAYIAAALEKHGHNVKIIDANALNLNLKSTILLLKNDGPDIVGLYFSTYMFRISLQWAEEIKKELKIPILAGGINLQLYPKESLMNNVIDFGFHGECIYSLPAFINQYEAGKNFLETPGLIFKKKNNIVINPKEKTNISFNEYPIPAWHLLPIDRYYSFISQRKNFCLMLTALGCPYNCDFCAIANIEYRLRSIDLVIKEIILLNKKYSVKEIDFFDADFTFNKKRTIEFCKSLIEKKLDLEWSCRTRIDNLNEEIIKYLSKSKCRQIYLGIESSNSKHIENLNKSLKISQVKEVIKLLKKNDIRPLGFFMTGLPEETPLDILKTSLFAITLKLDYAQFSRLIPKPNSNLHFEIVKKTGKDFWKDWILGNEVERRIGSPWTKMNEKKIEKYTKIAYYLFYYRPFYILKALTRMRSFNEFFRSFISAAKMILSFFKSDS